MHTKQQTSIIPNLTQVQHEEVWQKPECRGCCMHTKQQTPITPNLTHFRWVEGRQKSQRICASRATVHLAQQGKQQKSLQVCFTWWYHKDRADRPAHQYPG